MENRNTLAWSGLLILLLAGCTFTPKETRSAAYERITRDLYDALNARDWDRFASHFQPNAKISVVQKVRGRRPKKTAQFTITEFIRTNRIFLKNNPDFKEELLKINVIPQHFTVNTWFRASDGRSGREAYRFVNADGQWKILLVIITNN